LCEPLVLFYFYFTFILVLLQLCGALNRQTEWLDFHPQMAIIKNMGLALYSAHQWKTD